MQNDRANGSDDHLLCDHLKRQGGLKEARVYLSDVAVVLAGSLDAEAEPKALDRTFKKELRERLVLLGQVVADHGLLCPVVGVIRCANQDQLEALRTWAVDAEWHRGGFLLYAEMETEDEGSNRSAWDARIHDILSPRTTLLGTLRSVTARDVAEDIRKRLSDTRADGLEELIRDLLDPAEENELPRDLKEAEHRVRAWMHRRLGEEVHEGDEEDTTQDAGMQHRHSKKLVRLHTIKVSRFRGFRKTVTLDLSADLILVVGPNGYGKSSLMEALLLALTGHVVRDHRNALEVVEPEPSEQTGTEREIMAAEDPRIVLRGVADGDVPFQIEIAAKSADSGGTAWSYVRKEGEKLKTVLEWSFKAPKPIEPTRNGISWKWGPESLGHPPGTPLENELQYRLSAYLQDSHRELFDEYAQGKSLRDVLEPPPLEAKLLQDAVGSVLRDDVERKVESLKAKLENLSPERRNALEKRLEEKLAPLRGLYEEMADASGVAWPNVPESLEGWGPLAVRLQETVTKRPVQAGNQRRIEQNPWKTLGESLLDYSTRRTNDLLEEEGHKETDREDLGSQEDIRALTKRKEELERRLPEAERRLKWLNPDSSQGETYPREGQLTAVFRLLRDHALEWADALPPGKGKDGGERTLPQVDTEEIPRVMEELALVDPALAERCYNEIKSWEDWARNTYEEWLHVSEILRQPEVGGSSPELVRWRDLRNKAKEVREQRIRPIENVWKDLRKWHTDQDERPAWKEKFEKSQELQQALGRLADAAREAIGPSESLRGGLREQMQRVVGRFAMAGDFEKMQLDPTTRKNGEQEEESQPLTGFTLRVSDGRSLPHFSTGQLGQLGVAYLVAQRQIANRDPRVQFPHPVLLLDDVSTSYDLTNLVREAVLWRQLAYHPEDGERLQVVLSSHHDELTNRLLDLLVPPGGRKLHVLQFTDWTSDGGPTIETFEVDPSPPVDDEGFREALADQLREVL